ncbi:geranylgeranylglyceryl/heptaprenylglyceryl phosphate synthase [Emticicia sp. 21SJ11W-3]|uniref:geranylgeranylglyceryl/heptaprenylglyceryl phosphate synthase n=1 Tax=Emticicia sp. 21SJ11W-3 TaxID=2916755 RepID=UPI00209FD692|nr:geranylgeranylglyceryl/heptaprenylglyceryl phosphate synthase [Emticicia sp. 21SJ11W-3]UTA68543.1 geranylgeranylglyceryl/heptaprenylglyceryl phosphate synthase [Emticicia sp. 21SJ11W-3]
MPKQLLDKILNLNHLKKKALAVLLDPDKVEIATFNQFLYSCVENRVDFFFVGGSLITNQMMAEMIAVIRQQTNIPVVIFPGNSLHIEPSADGILLLSLISGRNPDYLIGQHVISAPLLKHSGLEILPTGYILVDSGRQTTVSYISNTTPIPHDKADIAACTAIAGEMLGLRLIYLDGGSGAINPVSAKMIRMVRENIAAPLIVGGGINSAQKAHDALEAGADIIVIGNAFEKNPALLPEIAEVVLSFNLITA